MKYIQPAFAVAMQTYSIMSCVIVALASDHVQTRVHVAFETYIAPCITRNSEFIWLGMGVCEGQGIVFLYSFTYSDIEYSPNASQC